MRVASTATRWRAGRVLPRNRVYGLATAARERPGPDRMAGQSAPPSQEGYGETVGGHLPVDQRPRLARATLFSTRRPRLPEESDANGAQVHRPAPLSAAFQSRGDRLFSTRSDDGPPEAGDGRAGGATVVGGSRATTFSRSIGHGLLRSGGCGRGWEAGRRRRWRGLEWVKAGMEMRSRGRRARRKGPARPSWHLSFVFFLCPFTTFSFVGR